MAPHERSYFKEIGPEQKCDSKREEREEKSMTDGCSGGRHSNIENSFRGSQGGGNDSSTNSNNNRQSESQGSFEGNRSIDRHKLRPCAAPKIANTSDF